MKTTPVSQALIAAAQHLRAETSRLKFGLPVTHAYNPLAYAWALHEAYLLRFGATRKRVVFLGMNPGPFGMVQTGVPFGEVAAVRDWLRIGEPVGRPAHEHPQRPVTGLACPRSEVSGRRLWGLFAERFRTPERFFAGHLVMNYCPLAFLESGGRNHTPRQAARRREGRPFRGLRSAFASCGRGPGAGMADRHRRLRHEAGGTGFRQPPIKAGPHPPSQSRQPVGQSRLERTGYPTACGAGGLGGVERRAWSVERGGRTLRHLTFHATRHPSPVTFHSYCVSSTIAPSVAINTLG